MSDRSPLHDLTAAAGAVFAEAGWLVPLHYGDPSAEYASTCDRAAVFDVSHRGKVVVGGADALSFLHNLCTNDIKKLPAGAGCEAFLCTAAARVVAHVLVYHLPPSLWLDLVPGQNEKVHKHLDRYIISEQVELADRTREYASVHLAGPEAPAVLTRVLGEAAPDLRELQHVQRALGSAGTCQLRRHRPLGLPGYDILCPVGEAGRLWQALVQAGARPAGLEAYNVLRVEAGTPAYGPDIDEGRLVMEVGRTAQAISYTKGCYLGQEPVVMARDRGHVNRTLLGLKLREPEVVPPGAKLFRDGKEVGQTASSVVSPRLGTAIALAYVRRGHQDPGTVVEVETAAGRRTAEVVSLPFCGVTGGD